MVSCLIVPTYSKLEVSFFVLITCGDALYSPKPYQKLMPWFSTVIFSHDIWLCVKRGIFFHNPEVDCRKFPALSCFSS